MKFLDRITGRTLFTRLRADVPTGNAPLPVEPCGCFPLAAQGSSPVCLHSQPQDTTCTAWRILEELIDRASANRETEFAPAAEMKPEDWAQITVLPPSISKLTTVRWMYLYGSYLVRIPAEIGAMTNLHGLDLYTSYQLHWMPFEITRCTRLSETRLSTRAVYGNYKHRPPFPDLLADATTGLTDSCSVCNASLDKVNVLRRWISLKVGTDVMPLLVNACSEMCLSKLPKPAVGYVNSAHTGGAGVQQPEPGYLKDGRVTA